MGSVWRQWEIGLGDKRVLGMRLKKLATSYMWGEEQLKGLKSQGKEHALGGMEDHYETQQQCIEMEGVKKVRSVATKMGEG